MLARLVVVAVTAVGSIKRIRVKAVALVLLLLLVARTAGVLLNSRMFALRPSTWSCHTAARGAMSFAWNTAALLLVLNSYSTAALDATVWTTATARPGVLSDVTIAFSTNGAIPIGGQLLVTLPPLDFSAAAGPLTATLTALGVMLDCTAEWDDSSLSIIVTLDGAASIDASTPDVLLTVQALATPPSVRPASRSDALLTTVDALSNVIDGPNAIDMDAITAGLVLGARTWIATAPFAGVTSDQTVTFSTSGQLRGSSTIAITLPDTQWSMAATGSSATVSTLALGDVVASATFDAATRTVAIVLPAATSISASSVVTIVVTGVSNPPRETGVCEGNVTTLAHDGLVIDGPGAISVLAIARGVVRGIRAWTSTAPTPFASMVSDFVLRVTLSGALPSGSSLVIELPDGVGWRFAAAATTLTAASATFTLPATGLNVQALTWTEATAELRVETLGDLSEGQAIELVVYDMVSPYEQQSAATLTLTTMLADSSVVDESSDIAVAAIEHSLLAQDAVWTSEVATPGIESSQSLALTLDGSVEVGARICVAFADSDGWGQTFASEATMSVAGAQPTRVTTDWDPALRSLCVTTAATLPQASSVVVQISSMESPPSVRAAQRAALTVFSHTNGLVTTGFVQLNAVVAGALTGALTWQSALFSPGPVAALQTNAALAFQTTGCVAALGQIVLTLPIEWQLDDCIVTFVQPVIASTAVCAANMLTVTLANALGAHSDVLLMVTRGVRNPPTVQPTGLALLETRAPDGGVIDTSADVTTTAIVAMLTAITSDGDTRTAVAGVRKVFQFDGAGVAAGDVLKFVDASTTNDANCGVDVAGVSDAGGLDITAIADDLTAALTFTQPSPDNAPFRVCYKFGANPFKLYAALSVTVKDVLAVTAAVGAATTAVADFAKTWRFRGHGIAAGDQVRWIRLAAVDAAAQTASSVDCLDETTLATLVPPTTTPLGAHEDAFTRTVQANGQSEFTFAAALAGETFCLCYRFGAEPFAVYPRFTVRVHHVAALTVSSRAVGSDTVAVVAAPKQFAFVGDGLVLNDRVYFIEAGSAASCAPSAADASLRIKLAVAGQDATLLFVTELFETTVQFTAVAAGKRVVPCYQFGSEPFMLYETIVLDVKMVSRFVGARGSPLLAVAAVAEPLTFVGYGLAPGDRVRWSRRGTDDCESHLVELVAETGESIDTVTLDAALSGAFTFAEMQLEYSPVLCYQFGAEPFQLYADLSIAIATIRAKTTAVGDRSVAVVAAHKWFTFVGTHLAPGDRVGWTTDDDDASCTTLALLVQDPTAPDDDYVAYTNARREASVALAAVSSGRRVFLCYGFGTEPLKLYTDLYLDVKSVRAMRSVVGGRSAAVTGALKSFLFDGDGVASGDAAKFVPASAGDCSPPGVLLTNIVKQFDDYDEMAMYLYETVAGVTVGRFAFATDAATAGLARVLCYRFGIEPFVYYSAFRLDIKTIWALRRVDATENIELSSQVSVAVVGERKLVAIDGVGVSERDAIKFIAVSATTANDEDCLDRPPEGLLGRDLVVFKNATLWFAFDLHSNGSAWQLCYKFDDEPYRLYPNVTLEVKQVLDVVDADAPLIAGLGHVATIGFPKRWQPRGAGMQVGDMAKFVASTVLRSADCGAADTANVAGGSAAMRVAGLDLAFTGTFTLVPAALSDVYHLCYKFQDEPYALVRGVEVRTFGVLSLDRSTVLAQASTSLQLAGFRLGATDRVAWTTSARDCSAAFAVSDVNEQRTTTLAIAASYGTLYLCYSFDRQPFVHYALFTITVAQADVWTPQTTSVVADQETLLRVAGTFGLTPSADDVAWVPADALACTVDVAEMYSSVMQTSVVSTTRSETAVARGGSAVLRVKFVPSAVPSLSTVFPDSTSLATWKLCYRFGSMPEMLLFSDVLCDVRTIDRVTLVQSDASATGSVLTFDIDGVGIQDFDNAKWVDAAAATSDADCDTLPAAGGSATVAVVAQRAQFAFVDAAPRLALCYQFQGHAYKLFANVPVQDATATSSSTLSTTLSSADVVTSSSSPADAATLLAQFADEREAATSGAFKLNRDVATAALTLAIDFATIPPGSPAESQFKTSVIASLAASLGIAAARVRIVALTEGSVVVHLELLPSNNVADVLVREAVADLQQQLADPTSALRQSAVIRIADPLTALSVSTTTPPTLSDASSAAASASTLSLQARGYQRNGLFTFVKTDYSVTEHTPRLVVPILRLQGTASAVTLVMRIDAAKRSATPGVDYRILAASADSVDSVYLRFDIGESVQMLELDVLDDDVKESHFEFVTLELMDPSTPDAALGATPTTVVRIYDYDDGVALVRQNFGTGTPRSHGVNVDDRKGWTIVENGDGPGSALRVDANGLFGVDAVVGDREYDERCDSAAPTAGVRDTALATRNVLELRDGDYVVSQRAIAAFPTEAFTLSLWVKTDQKTAAACLVSYAVPRPTAVATAKRALSSSSTSTVALALCNPTSLELHLNARSRRDKLATFVDISDGAWHFVAVAWSATDGRVRVFDNGMLAFDGGPFRVGARLAAGGSVVVGALVSPSAATPCTLEQSSPVDGVGSTTRTVCTLERGSQFLGQVQHVHVWSRIVARAELLKELASPMRVATNGLVFGWNFDAPYVLESGALVSDISTKGQNMKTLGAIHCARSAATAESPPLQLLSTQSTLSPQPPCLVAGVLPSIAPASLPCVSRVDANVWHFAASPTVVQALRHAYGGRLQYEMLAPSANGSPRKRRGQLSVFDSSGAQMSLALGAFPLPTADHWTSYVAVLREDFGWLSEPSGTPIAPEAFAALLADATALWLRGDLWGPDAHGQGQEAVYLNRVAVFAR